MSASETFAFPELDGWRIDSPRPRPADEVDPVAEAARRGHDEGLAAGRALAEAELEPLRAALRAAAAALGAAREEVVTVAEERAVDLAVRLAEKIVATALEVDPRQLLTIVEGALRHLTDADDVVLEVNPADVALLQAEVAALDA